MSYVLVKRIAIGRQEVAVAPSIWIEQGEKGTSYVFFPKTDSTQKINALLENQTKPTAEWEKHKCEILRKNIPSVSDAYAIIELMFNPKKVAERGKALAKLPVYLPTTPPKGEFPMLPIKPANKETPKAGQQRKLLVEVKRTNPPDTDQDYDPFADIPTLPVLEDLRAGIAEAQLLHSVRVKQEDEDEPDHDSKSPQEGPQSSNSFTKRRPMENMEKFFAGLNKQMSKQHGVLIDELPTSISQLFDTLLELKCLLQSNQAELRKEIKEGFYQLQKTVLSTIGKEAPDEKNAEANTAAFEMKQITCRKEMDELEVRLNDETYRKKVLRWIDGFVANVTAPERRMTAILYHLMDKNFFSFINHLQMSSVQRKNGMAEWYPNVYKLFEYAGTTRDRRADDRFVECFFRKKLKPVQAGVNPNGKRQGEPIKSSTKNPRTELEKKAEEKGKHKAVTAIVSVTPRANRKNDVSEVIEMDCDENKQNTSTTKAASGTAEAASSMASYAEINPINTFDGMNGFEAQLANPHYRGIVHSWIDRTVQRVVVPAERMDTILEKLVDREFLKKFDWGGFGLKRALKNYTNFLNLFLYVGTIEPWHQANLRQVQDFFHNKFLLIQALDTA